MLTIFSNVIVFAQVSDFSPKPAYAFPAGAKAGSVVNVFIFGQKMKNCQIMINDPEIKAKVIDDEFDRTGAVETEQRQAIRRLTTSAGTAIDKETLNLLPNWAEFYPYKQKLKITEADSARVSYKFGAERERVRPSSEFANTILVELKIPKAAKKGRKELRLKSRSGESRPIYFFVDSIPETFEIEPEGNNQIQVEPLKLPVCVNGQIYPGDFDILKFKAKKGKTIEISTLAREIRPFIADGVPGWFEAKLTLFSPSGKIMKYSDCSGFRPDPSIIFKAPETGVYSVEIRDNIYRGREDFVYRLKIANYRSKKVDSFPHKIQKNGQVNRHKFSAKKGEKLSISTLARKLGSQIDTFIQVVDKTGNILAQNDDIKLSHRVGLQTVFCDSNLIFEAPKDGDYAVLVSDTLQKGGENYGYKLSIKPAKADFDVYTTTSRLPTIAGFGSMIIFKAERYNNLTGDIEIKIKDKKSLFWLEGAIIPAGATEVAATLFVSNDFSGTDKKLEFVAQAVNSSEVVVDVTPADDWEQAFLWRHLIPTTDFSVSVSKPRSTPPYFINKTEKTIKIGDNKTFSARYKTSDTSYDHSKLGFSLKKAPRGITLMDYKYKDGFITFTFSVEEKAKSPGNIIIDKTVTKQFTRNEKKRTVKHSLGVLPPLPYKL